MSVIPRGSTKAVKVVYPVGCKEVVEELGKDELVRRLKLIARAFQDMGQDENEQYSGLAIHLATEFFMDHQNKDVRLLVACCIADVFRIFAPEAPYRDANHLKDIFMFLNKQLRGLEDPTSPTFKRYFYLLENLAWVKSFNICIELDDNQEIFCSLFQLMFSVINEKHTSKVKNFMLDMMTPLLTEADTVSQELLDILLINIVEPHKTQNRHAFQLAKDLLVRTSTAIEPYIQAFFNNALMLGKTSQSELSNHLYDLIYELNSICPAILLSVLPQLEFKLKSNEESERKSVTKILAKMFSDPGSNLAEQNKPLWNCFLGRFNDISITVRTVCVQSSQSFILYHPELVKDVVEQIKVRQHDPEETVRMEVVNTLLNIAKKNFDCMSGELLDFIKERTRDKKFKIRREALLGLGQLYKYVTGNQEVSQSQLNKILWVKDKVFHAYYQASSDDKLLVERIFNICLVPYQLPTSERMKRLFLLYATLDDHAVKAFGEMMKYRHVVRNQVRQVLDIMEEHVKQPVSLMPRLSQIARTLPEPQKALEQMKKFHDVLREDKRLRAYLRILVSPECTCKKANETVNDILKKLGGGNPSTSNSSQLMLYSTVKFLLERIAPVMVDAASISVLVQHIDDSVKGLGTLADGIENAAEKGVQLLLSFSSVFPDYFKLEDTFSILLTFLKDEDEAVADTTLQIFANCGRNLQKKFSNIYTSLMPLLQHQAKIGNPKQAKHAIRCISAISENKEAIFQQIFEHLKTNLNPDSANYITSIVALGHIALLCPDEFNASMKSIVSKNIVKDLLMQDRTTGTDTTESWYSDHLVTEETQAKIQAMKLLMRWLLGLKSNANNSGTSTLRLLYTVIVHEGDLMEKGMINKPELARLRLQAGCCFLRLAEEPVYADLVTREHFQALALLINDSCFHVRLKFANKLNKGLFSLRLSLEYMSIFSLAANDPLRERRTQIKKCIQSNIVKRRDYLKQNPNIGGKMYLYLPDYVMPYTIHLLSHDPDLKSFDDVSTLKNIKECLWFIMEPLVSRSEDYNYHFFRRIIENIKQTRDAQGPEDEDMNKKLYAVCDVALGLLQRNLSNIVLKDSNVDPVLPGKLFTKPDKASLNTQVYLPKDFTFEKKKGFLGFSDAPATTYKSHKQAAAPQVTSAQEIIVESPGPVVNPNPTCPREPRTKATKKTKSEQVGTDSSQTDASTDSRESSVEGTKPVRRGRPAKTENADDKGEKPQKASRKRKQTPVSPSVSSEGDSQSVENLSQESEAMETSQDSVAEEDSPATSSKASSESPSTPIKKRILKKKMAEEAGSGKALKRQNSKSNSSNVETKGAKGAAKKETGKGVVNGAAKVAAKRTSQSDSDSSSNQGSAKKRKVEPSSTKQGKAASTGAQKQTKKVVKKAEKGQSPASKSPAKSASTRSTPTKSSASSSPSKASPARFKSPTGPAPKASPKKKVVGGAAAKFAAAKSRVTRGVLKSKSPSPKSSSSDGVPSPSASPRKGAKKVTVDTKKKPVPKVTIKMKNVRRARTLANGTSDGEDTPETDSSMSPAKSSALSKAIQKAGLGKEVKKTVKTKKK